MVWYFAAKPQHTHIRMKATVVRAKGTGDIRGKKRGKEKGMSQALDLFMFQP